MLIYKLVTLQSSKLFDTALITEPLHHFTHVGGPY